MKKNILKVSRQPIEERSVSLVGLITLLPDFGVAYTLGKILEIEFFKQRDVVIHNECHNHRLDFFVAHKGQDTLLLLSKRDWERQITNIKFPNKVDYMLLIFSVFYKEAHLKKLYEYNSLEMMPATLSVQYDGALFNFCSELEEYGRTIKPVSQPFYPIDLTLNCLL